MNNTLSFDFSSSDSSLSSSSAPRKEAFNYQMLELARDSRGMTQKKLAESINRTQAAVSQWEKNLRQPAPADVTVLAKVLSYPEDFFFQSSTDSYLPPVQGHYRKKAALKAASRAKLEAHFRLLGGWINKLADAVEPEDGIAYPSFSPDEYTDINPEDLARRLRANWHVPNGPIRSLTSLLERKWIIVSKTWLSNENIDAYSFFTSRGVPVIYVNKDASLDRLRFSMAHELGHLVMHSDCLPSPEREREADRFASEFLMPSHDIYSQLVNINLDNLASLKARWGCSMAAIIRRAHTLGVISDEKKKGFLIDMAPYRKKEPIDLQRHGFSEHPLSLKNMISCHLDDLEMSHQQLQEMLFLENEDFSLLLASTGNNPSSMFVSRSNTMRAV